MTERFYVEQVNPNIMKIDPTLAHLRWAVQHRSKRGHVVTITFARTRKEARAWAQQLGQQQRR
jgi:hypothetical protein